MKRLIIASKNKKKVEEIVDILNDFPFEVVSMEQAGINNDIEETGKTFEENAKLKAVEIFKASGEPAFADDSGIEIDYLDGKPGIYSARFAGKDATDDDRNKKILKMLEGVPYEKRTARFICAIALVLSENEHFIVKGICEGIISKEPKGENGFGYDPIFYVPEYNMTTAQMPPAQKHKISHRGKALDLMVEELKKYMKNT